MPSNLNPIIDSYAKGKISAINFNMDSDTISVAIRNQNGDENTEIVFEDVKAFYYIDHDSKSETELLLSNDVLNAISYDDFGFGEFSAHAEDDDLFVTVPNFALNLEASSLFIDAHKIRINDQAYHVKSK